MPLQMKSFLSKGILRAAFSNHFRMTASSYIFFIGLAGNSQVIHRVTPNHSKVGGETGARLASRLEILDINRDLKHI